MSLLPPPFVALTVNLEVPDTTGMPVMTPLEESNVKPSGNVPATIFHDRGESPIAAKD